MAALTNNRKAAQYGTNGPLVQEFRLPVNGGSRIFAGGMVALNSEGNAIPAGLSAGGSVRAMGVAQAEANNTAGADGALFAQVRRGAFPFANSTAGDAITIADVGATVFVVDDQTVAKTNGTSTRIAAGKCVGFDGAMVLVEVGI